MGDSIIEMYREAEGGDTARTKSGCILRAVASTLHRLRRFAFDYYSRR